MKKNERGFCLLHNSYLDRKTIYTKCNNSHRKNGKRCSHLVILKEKLVKDNGNVENDVRN